MFHYSGDQDSVIPLTGSCNLVQKLARQLGLNTIVPYRGASHAAPFSQPERSFVLFKSFLEDRLLPEIL